jgi:ATP phosphoribosyltransferase
MKGMRIGIGKGRGLDRILESLNQVGIETPTAFRERRRLVVTEPRFGLVLVLARQRDLPRLLREEHVDLVIGSNVWFLEEQVPALTCIRTLGFGECRLSLLTQRGGPLREIRTICTRFGNIARRFAPGVDVFELNGCNEIALSLGFADAVVDVVETGQTLREMHLEETRILAKLQHSVWGRNKDGGCLDLVDLIYPESHEQECRGRRRETEWSSSEPT